jgi:hypothetical protein
VRGAPAVRRADGREAGWWTRRSWFGWSPGATGRLYRRTSPWLAVRLRRRCADDELVAEVLQETYLAIWRAAAAFAGAAVVGMVTATWFTGDQLAPAEQLTRDAIGMTGLSALGAATLGANRAWIPPLSWTLLSWTLMEVPWPSPATYRQVLTWMLQPADATPATVTALVLGATGVLAYAVLGPAHERPC